MVKVENIETMGWRKAIKGMRNPMNSWDKMDSGIGCSHRNTWAGEKSGTLLCQDCGVSYDSKCVCTGTDKGFKLGQNDLDLACRLIKAGPEHRKFLRMIHVQMDITAPLYWIAEHDTYKIGTTKNSCSFMHKGVSKPFKISDFSIEHGLESEFLKIIETLNFLRESYLKSKNETLFFMIRQLLPQGYNVTYTWDCSMETILNILTQRNHHRLPEWQQFRQACFDNIPYCKEFYEALCGKEEN